MQFVCWDDQGERVIVDGVESAREAAESYAASAGWDSEPGMWTWFYKVWVAVPEAEVDGVTLEAGTAPGSAPGALARWPLVDDSTESFKIPVEPEAPPCVGEDGTYPGHEFEEVKGSIRGHGGGVTYTEQCQRCGLHKHTDTWHADQQDGTQGHTAIRYQAPDEIAAAMVRDAMDNT